MRTSTSTVGTVERMLSLNRMPILAGLAPEDLAVVAEHARERFFTTGSVLLREGEPVPALFAVIDGRVLISRKGLTLGRVRMGGFVGAAGMFARDPDGLTAVAETDTIALELETDAVLEICGPLPIFHHVLREMCRLLIDLMARLPSPLYKNIFPPPVTLRAHRGPRPRRGGSCSCARSRLRPRRHQRDRRAVAGHGRSRLPSGVACGREGSPRARSCSS